ncbi:MAG: alanine racemase [Clostridia bacterium]|nr:alanine racemase [Clostridia bacterium]
MQKVIAKINLKAIEYNAAAFKSLSKTKLCAVVKADAYGHGAEAVACALSAVADMFAVALLDEAKSIRVAACGKPVLVLTPPADETQAAELILGGFIASVPDLKTARLVAETAEKFGRRFKIHLKVNTGMNRYGMNASLLGKVCLFLKAHPQIEVEGLYSHLYTHSREESERQRLLFLRMKGVCERYYPSVLCHLSATYGALLGEAFSFDMVRVGLGLYGYLPEGIDPALRERISLRPAMAVYAQAVQSRKYSFGGVGYGVLCEEAKTHLSYLTVWRVGYADGFGWKKDNGMNGGEKNLSNLCMDVCVRKGRRVRGSFTPVMTDAAETAEKSGTICYEILCAATRRAEFVYEYR